MRCDRIPGWMKGHSAYLAIPVIAGLVSTLYVACVGIGALLQLPWDIGLPWPVRLLGAIPIAYAVLMLGWVFRFRGPLTILESTWVTLLKLVHRLPLEVAGGRTEPLVVAGPYRIVRHPLYSGVDGLTLGIAILVDHPWAYLGALALGLWFALVLAPFEERELRSLFGEAYASYSRTVRRFLPIRRGP